MRRASPLATCLVLCLAAAGLSGCALAVGAGAGVGVVAAEERGLRGRASDLQIEAQIVDAHIKDGIRMMTAIGVEVYEGRVLLTGATEDQSMADRAVQIAWSVPGVQAVMNEIQITTSGAADFAQDSWISAQLSSKLALDKDILSINYSIETVNRVVYLIGIAQNRAELDKVIAHANNIQYVTKVVNHVRLKQGSAPAA
jgi:osmotically-inducible protein OsmY